MEQNSSRDSRTSEAAVMPTTPPSGRAVFEILAAQHADMLVAYLRSLVRRDDLVEDLFQETMLIAWRRLSDYDRDRPFGPWLRGIATRLVLKHRERSARDLLHCEPAVLESLETRFLELEPEPESFGHGLDRLRTCLERLTGKLRETVLLAYREALLLRQVAERTSSSEEAVKKRLQRGRQLLADCLRAGGAS